MKTKNLKTPITLILGIILFANIATAQTVTVNANTLTKPTSGTVTVTVTRSADNTWSGSNTNWSISPSKGTTITGSGITRTISFDNTAVAGKYTISVKRGETQYAYINLVVTTQGSANLWAAYGDAGSNSEIHTFSMTNGVYSSGPTSLFNVGQTFWALGKSKYPTPETGNFYWIPAISGNNGSFTIYGRKGDGSGASVAIGTLDLNGENTDDLGFVRLGLDKDNVAWILASNGIRLYLAKVALNCLNAVTPVIIDDNVTLIGGNANTFSKGDLCLDGNGNLYVLANNNGTTELYIGQPNGTNTIITKKWNINSSSGDAFAGSVNGNAFDQFGGMYFSTTDNSLSSGIADGIYYMNPSTILNTPTGSTINAELLFSGSGYTDLASNFFPATTALPVIFEETKGMIKSGELLVNWTTSSENNNDRFDIEVSKDGKNFVNVGTVKSKSNNGKSDKALQYNFSVKYNDAKSLLSLSIFSIAFILLAFNRRNKLLVMLFLFAGTSFFGTSCKKASTEQIDINNENKLFVRIVQIDKDGKSESSKIFTAYIAD